MRFDATRALIVYSGVLTLVVAGAATGAAVAPAGFDTIDVHRINVREYDGTLRLVIAARDRFPGIIFRKHEQPHPDRGDAAGMIFYNDEGTENGGLIFGGRRTGAQPTAFGHLSFDQYEQDQVTTLEQSEAGGRRKGGLTIADRPDAPLDFAAIHALDGLSPAARAAAIERMRRAGTFGRTRAFVGKDVARDALVDLHDAAGRTRLRLRVTADGAARIEFLDADGTIARTIAARQ